MISDFYTSLKFLRGVFVLMCVLLGMVDTNWHTFPEKSNQINIIIYPKQTLRLLLLAHLGGRLPQHAEGLLVCDLAEVLIVDVEDLVAGFEAAVLGCRTVRVNLVDDYSTLGEERWLSIHFLYHSFVSTT